MRDCISARGWILDFQRFSNTAALIRATVSGNGLTRLVPELQDLDIVWNGDDLDVISRQTEGVPEDDDVLLSLHVTFVHNEPDLKIACPKVPG